MSANVEPATLKPELSPPFSTTDDGTTEQEPTQEEPTQSDAKVKTDEGECPGVATSIPRHRRSQRASKSEEEDSKEVVQRSPREYHIVPPNFISEEKKNFDVATKDDPATVTVTVWISLGISLVLLLLLVSNVSYTVFFTRLQKADLEHIIQLDDRFERLKALNEIHTQILLHYIKMVIVAILFGIFFAFGSYSYFRDTKQHEITKRLDIKEKAKDVFHANELHILEKDNKYNLQKQTEEKLMEDIEKYKRNVNELKKDTLNNKKEIDRLNHKKQMAEEKLKQLQEDMEATEKDKQEAEEQTSTAEREVNELRRQVEQLQAENDDGIFNSIRRVFSQK